MIDFLNTLDSNILLFFNSFHCDFLDKFMWVVTGKYIWLPFYLAVVVLILRNQGWKKGLIWILALLLAVGIADQICASIIRPMVGRLRPSNELNPISQFVHIVDGYRGGAYGFPSCHGSNSFALATLVCLLIRRFSTRAFICGWALLNVYSRIYLGVHYPGDIFCGAIIGICMGLIVYFSLKKILNRLGRNSEGKLIMEENISSYDSLSLETATSSSAIAMEGRWKFAVPGIVFLTTLLAITVYSM